MRLIIVLFAFTGIMYAQVTCNLSISGKVVSDADRNKMCHADVFIKDSSIVAKANDEGYFEMKNLCPGKYILVCSHVGYFKQEVEIDLQSSAQYDFYLKENEVELHGFTLEDHDDKVEILQPQYTMEGVHLDKNRGSTLGESLKQITGMFTLNTGNSISKPVLHGMHSKRLLIINNGIRQEGQQWGQEHGPEIDPFIANKITVIKGAAGVRYGSDAIAGVVLIEPAAIIAPVGVRGDLYLNMQPNGWMPSGSLMLEGSFKKAPALSFRVQGSFKKGGDISTPGYLMANTGVEEFNVSGGLGFYKQKAGVELFASYFHTRLGIFAASHFGNITDLQNAIMSPVPLIMRDFSYDINRPYQQVNHLLTKLKFYHTTGEKSKLEFAVAFQENRRQEFDHEGTDPNDPSLLFILQSVNADIHWTHSFHKKMKGGIGLSGNYQTNRWDGFYFIPNFRNTNLGIFWYENLKLGHWDLEAGVRYDLHYLQAYMYKNNVIYSPDFIFQNASANAGAIYHISDHLTARANYGYAWRPPHVSELYSDGLHHGSASYEVGDTSLVPEKAHNVNISFNMQFKRFKMELTGYYYYIEDYIFLRPTLEYVLTIRGAFPGFEYTGADVDIKGIDLDATVDITKRLQLNSKSSFLWAWNYTQNDFLIQMPPFRFQNDLTYKFKDTKTIKNPYLNANILVVTQQYQVPSNSDYLTPPPAYFLVGFSGGVDFNIKNIQTISVSVVINNLLDNPYRDYMNRFRYFSNEMGRNIQLKIKIPLEFNKYKRKKV